MWLPSVIFILTLSLHTTTHAERSSPTLKDVERFRIGACDCCSREIKLELLILTEYHAYTLNIKLNTISMQSESHEFSLASLESNTITMECCKYLKKSEDVSGNYTTLHATRAEHEETMYHETDDEYSVGRMLIYMILITITFVASVYITGMNRCLYIVDQIIKDVMSLICVLHMSCGCDCHCETESSNKVLIHSGSHTQPTELESVNIEDVNISIVSKQELRSRYARFLHNRYEQMSYVYSVEIKHEAKRHVRSRDREPSRIPAKKICRLLKKSRKLRKLVRRHIRRNVPRSSHIFRLFKASSCERQRLLNHQVRNAINIYNYTNTTSRHSNLTPKPKRWLKPFHFKSFKNNKKRKLCKTHKSLNHLSNCCKFNLSGDIEPNPGPVFVEPSKTIHAPYSQGNIAVFGPNAGTQCVAMSLCALMYKFTERAITCPDDLIVIMDIGNELYSALSSLSRQTFLLLTELPNMVTVFDTNYHLQFSESYTGGLHVQTIDDDNPFVVPFTCAMQNLLQENYDSFLVTIGCNTVSVYLMLNGSLKIFDSHARDSFGMPQPHGTCVLLEVSSVDRLAEYFKTCYNGDVLFELKGVKIVIGNEQPTNSINDHAESGELVDKSREETDIITFSELCAIYIYSICFSTIKMPSYFTNP